jgi:para-nitrobenzyl esterase
MASPLSKHLFASAIGDSGSLLGTLPAVPLAETEQKGVKFADSVGATSLAALRAMPAKQVLAATLKPNMPRFALTVDGYFFPKNPATIFVAGEQASVPLLVGWNSEENNYRSFLGQDKPTSETFKKAVQKIYNDRADEVVKLYPGTTDEEIMQAATDLAGDRFIGYSTWKWSDVHSKTSGKPCLSLFILTPTSAPYCSNG